MKAFYIQTNRSVCKSEEVNEFENTEGGGARQGCVMSSRWFILFMTGVSRGMKASVSSVERRREWKLNTI